MKFPILYTKSSTGQIYEWKIFTEGCNVVTEYGVLGTNKTQRAVKKCIGKNIGKKNETSPEEQAILEARSKHQKRLKLEYQLSPELAAQHFCYLPMTAESFENFSDRIEYPASIQPKLDGCRAMAVRKNGKVVLISRGNEEWELDWICKELSDILPEGCVFDGELYAEGMSFEDIESLVSKIRPDTETTIRYHIFDIPEWKNNKTLSWKERSELLYNSKLAVQLQQSKYCKIVSCLEVYDESQIFDTLKLYENEGYEGAMLRCYDGIYEFNNRSRKLLKIKTFCDSEYEIVGYKNGSGKYSKCVIWECVTENGLKFDVVPKGSMDEKHNLLLNADEHIGKKLKVKYFNLTENGIPRFPVGIGIRIDKDMG